jgi:glycosyltransferase involved in cell wall biosynthesis
MASRPAAHGVLQSIAERGIRIPPEQGQSDGPGVVHFIGTGWDFAGFGFLRAARSSRALFTILPAVHPGSWGDDVIDLRLYKQADAVFCLSDHERLHLGALGVPEEKLVKTVLPPMCRADGDRERFRALHQLGGRPVVLFMGRRDEGKGYPSVLRAWVEVLRQAPSAVLCLAGPGGSEFAQLMSELPGDSYRDLGVPDEREKADALAGCDVFCLPSAHESFGLVYLEAWVYGKAVVCGTAPASRELVENQRTGLHGSQDPDALAGTIINLLTNPDLARTLGAAGLSEQSQRYTMNAMLDGHLSSWRTLSAS